MKTARNTVKPAYRRIGSHEDGEIFLYILKTLFECVPMSRSRDQQDIAIQCDSDFGIIRVCRSQSVCIILLSYSVVVAACVSDTILRTVCVLTKDERILCGLHYANNKLRNAFEIQRRQIFYSIFMFRVRHAARGHLYAISQLLMWSTIGDAAASCASHSVYQHAFELSLIFCFLFSCRRRWRKSRSN